MRAAYEAGSKEWTPTTEHMYDEMLGAVPPAVQVTNAFVCGEPWNHNDRGEAVYAAFRRLPGPQFVARYMTVREFRAGE